MELNQKELKRLEELKKVHEKKQTIAATARILNLSERQVKRLSKQLRLNGPQGLISKKRNVPSNRKFPQHKEELVLNLIKQHYTGLKLIKVHERLTKEHAIEISLSSIRTIMIRYGLWKARSRKKYYRAVMY